MFKFLRFVLLAALWLTFSVAYAAEVAIKSEEAKEWAVSKGQELLLTLSESDTVIKYSKLDKMLEEDVNLDYVSKFVIGKYARLMNKEQADRYNNLFHRYMASIYKLFDLEFDAQAIKFSVDGVEEHPSFTTVSCTINPNFSENEIEIQKLPVKFKLIRGTNNRIQAVDVEIAEISMVIEYRKKFYQMIKEEEEDINWFLDRFDAKVKANENAFLKNAKL